jgi:hypothetical protein
MKKSILIAGLLLALIGCKKAEVVKVAQIDYAVFGDSISDEDAILAAEMNNKYATLKEGDTLNVKFKSKITSVCQAKGCWMNLELSKDKQVFVKFKDYAFFVPKNAENEEVVINGKAFVSVESIEVLKHYAKDAGASQAAIDSIIAPKTTYSFLADGVLIKK